MNKTIDDLFEEQPIYGATAVLDNPPNDEEDEIERILEEIEKDRTIKPRFNKVEKL